MKSYTQLPDGYGEIFRVNLQKDKRLAIIINAVAVAIALVMVLPTLFFIPFQLMISEEIWLTVVRFVVLAVGIVSYIVLHEAVHVLAMKLCGTKKVKFGFTGLYAYAGSDDYYTKGSYLFIALAPVVLWGIVLLLANLFVPLSWFWVVFLVQVVNLSGAAGDYFVTLRFLRFPKDILVCDHGVGMQIYSQKEQTVEE